MLTPELVTQVSVQYASAHARKLLCLSPSPSCSMPVDHLTELLWVVLLHEDDGFPGLLARARVAWVDAVTAEHIRSND